jgi:hypothetical protein
MNRGYLKLIKKLFILLLIMFIVDRGVGSIIEYYWKAEPMGDAAAFSHAINNPKEDILIYGSSKAVHTYDTRVLTDSLSLSCFNCGREATNVIYHAAILPSAINGNHKPKAIILDLTYKEIAWRSGKYGEDVLAGIVLPYVLTNDHFAQLAKELFPNELLKAKISKLYAYNSLILSIIRNYSRRRNDNINGYQPLHGTRLKSDPEILTSARDKIDEYSKEKLEYFAKAITDKKIPLIVIVSPVYSLPYEDNESLRVSKQILARYNIQVWDYSSDPRYVKRENFYDMAHMNSKGAEMFSKEIASRIKQLGIIRTDHPHTLLTSR